VTFYQKKISRGKELAKLAAASDEKKADYVSYVELSDAAVLPIGL